MSTVTDSTTHTHEPFVVRTVEPAPLARYFMLGSIAIMWDAKPGAKDGIFTKTLSKPYLDKGLAKLLTVTAKVGKFTAVWDAPGEKKRHKAKLAADKLAKMNVKQDAPQ